MESIVTVPGGQVRGATDHGVARYLGIPYAAAAAGPAAFEPPRPVVAWDGVRDATVLGPTAPQPPYEPPFDGLLANPLLPGDEFLNLNVWTPGGSGLPVLVFFHGGAFRNGSNAIPAYDGAAFARDGVVLVGVNYRLGVQGFGVVEDAPSNRGLLDQVAALEWVRDTIATFGGDPDQVTICGQSAGAMSVATLMAVPAARGLFRRAIVQSGKADATASESDAALVTAELAKRLGVPATVAGLGSVRVEDLIAAQRQVALELRQAPDPQRWGATTISAGGGIMPFFPVIDGDLLHEQPLAAIAAGASSGLELLAGTTREEFNFFMVPTGQAAAITAEALPLLLARLGLDPAVAATYAPGRTPGEIVMAITGEYFFTQPTIQLAEAQRAAGGTAYLYQFTWPSPLEGMGACHSLELPFVFDNLATATSPLYGTEPPQELADRIHAAWVAFATTGDPGWSPYEATAREVQVFGQTLP
ncbi:para-nitrobenzyl esterase [Kribbella amoyensis]|uniref:Carboxylic ester hydrolase n=1 Tax=Kribbella amoyensis TaxID=996641 RepID=A0A561BWY0_9ACTN|nr:carboxylesterase family protein [Kribbella amoyensis]TWD83395.1 para-nitrobenzyl esterase [Kribbella amoyensis]